MGFSIIVLFIQLGDRRKNTFISIRIDAFWRTFLIINSGPHSLIYIYVSVGQMAEIQLHPSYIFVALLPQPLKYLGDVLEGERHAFGGIWTIGRIKHGSGSPEISKCAMAIPGG